ncbi:MAG TPA: 2-C-methyl-D-erythritol 4-phosphate cytidylyltransferase [Syntrophales bacterium]
MRVVALIPSAGRGKRMGAEKPKAFLRLGSVPILVRTLQIFENSPLVNEIVAVVPPGEGVKEAEEMIRRSGLKKILQVLPGGEERQESVWRGLTAIRGRADWVIVHDVARPFLPPELIERTLSEARRSKAVAVALPAHETLKEISPGKEVVRTMDRRHVWMAQTPQCFEFNLILNAYEQARKDGFLGTDDASLVERLGIPVRVIEGSRFNFKITTPEDLILAEALLKIWKAKD